MAEDPKKLQEALKLLKELNTLRMKMNKEPLKLSDEQAVKQLKSLPGDIDDARAAMDQLAGSASGLYGTLKNITKEITGQDKSQKDLNKAFNSLVKDAEKLKFDEQEITKLGVKDLKNLQKRVQENKQRVVEGAKQIKGFDSMSQQVEKIVKFGELRGKKEEQINDDILKSISRKEGLSDVERELLALYFSQGNELDKLTKKTEERLGFEKEIERKAAGFSTLAGVVKSIPGLSGLSGPFEKAAQAAKDTAREGGNGLQSFAAGGKALMKAFAPMTLFVGMFKFLKDAAFGIDEKQTTIAKSMSLSVTESKAMYTQFKGIKESSDNVLATTKNLIKAQGSLASAMGVTRGFSKQQLEDQVKMVNNMGLEEATAGRLQSLSMASGKSSADSLKSIISTTQALKMQTGIQLDQKGVIDEVAKTEGQLAANYGNNPKLIAKAVTQVRKLGLNLSQAAKMSSSMLDFEQSLSNEMEAEVLLGRDLNLSRARALALQGDAAGAAAEIRKQVGSLSDFQDLNVVQQQALADAVGMTADELANSLLQEQNINKLGKETQKQIKERVAQLRAEGKTAEANRLLSQTANEEDAAAALERLTAQQEFQAAMDRVKETFAEVFDKNFDLAGVVRSIAGVFQSISKNLGLIKGIAAAVVGIMAGMAIKSTITAISAMTTAAASTLGLGMLPILGGIAAGSALLMSSSKKAAGSSKKIKDGVIDPSGGLMVSGQKGSIQLDKKDSIVAGTNLNGGNGGLGTEKLMQKIDKLISIVEKGGNVYIDGSKVGEALVLSSKLST